mmetsp:Transcript_7503/g.29601  ORF Transcript_7503/g.29601 Transcript_7503/m.29601 type:complete len:636 (+) Transcript_7503:5973-7880(+)
MPLPCVAGRAVVVVERLLFSALARRAGPRTQRPGGELRELKLAEVGEHGKVAARALPLKLRHRRLREDDLPARGAVADDAGHHHRRTVVFHPPVVLVERPGELLKIPRPQASVAGVAVALAVVLIAPIAPRRERRRVYAHAHPRPGELERRSLAGLALVRSALGQVQRHGTPLRSQQRLLALEAEPDGVADGGKHELERVALRGEYVPVVRQRRGRQHLVVLVLNLLVQLRVFRRHRRGPLHVRAHKHDVSHAMDAAAVAPAPVRVRTRSVLLGPEVLARRGTAPASTPGSESGVTAGRIRPLEERVVVVPVARQGPQHQVHLPGPVLEELLALLLLRRLVLPSHLAVKGEEDGGEDDDDAGDDSVDERVTLRGAGGGLGRDENLGPRHLGYEPRGVRRADVHRDVPVDLHPRVRVHRVGSHRLDHVLLQHLEPGRVTPQRFPRRQLRGGPDARLRRRRLSERPVHARRRRREQPTPPGDVAGGVPEFRDGRVVIRQRGREDGEGVVGDPRLALVELPAQLQPPLRAEVLPVGYRVGDGRRGRRVVRARRLRVGELRVEQADLFGLWGGGIDRHDAVRVALKVRDEGHERGRGIVRDDLDGGGVLFRRGSSRGGVFRLHHHVVPRPRDERQPRDR